MSRARNKEESQRLRVEYARVQIKDQDHRTWLRYVKTEGNELVLYAQPMVGNKLSEEELNRRERQKVAEREAREKRKEEHLKSLERQSREKVTRARERLADQEQRLKRQLEVSSKGKAF